MANHTLANKPLVNTYTVSVDAVNWPSHPDDAQDLLRSMAKQGGGKYVAVSNNAQALVDELDKIFQEIAAVNSVFASVTLPVNVNASGQSLNQIYMGVFRPDAGASPRWPGNLKEFKIEVKSTGPTMVGRNCAGTPPNQVCDTVHDPVNGFLFSTAQSFWTTANTANITQLVLTRRRTSSSLAPTSSGTAVTTRMRRGRARRQTVLAMAKRTCLMAKWLKRAALPNACAAPIPTTRRRLVREYRTGSFIRAPVLIVSISLRRQLTC